MNRYYIGRNTCSCTSFKQGDILLVDFGRNESGSRIGSRRPSIVVSNTEILKNENILFVVPLYRQPSRGFMCGDIVIEPKDCRGLRYVQYLQPMQVKAIKKCRVVRAIGYIKNDDLKRNIVATVQCLLSDECGGILSVER